MKKINLKKKMSYLLITAIVGLNAFAITISNSKIESGFNLQSLITTANADSEGGYGNGYYGDCSNCIYQDPSTGRWKSGADIDCWQQSNSQCIELPCMEGWC